MNKRIRRTPENYNGTEVTTRRVGDILPAILDHISNKQQDRPDLIMAAWPEIIGSKLAPMTQVVSFVDGILTVKVLNSTLHSLLSRHDKLRILSALRGRFPKVHINNIIFRIA